MAKYYQRKMVPFSAPYPVAQPMTGLQPMQRWPVDAAVGGQDRVASLTRRVLCTGGLQGDNWLTENSATPRQTTPQNFPLIDTPRPCADAYVRLTPGCFPELHVIYMLSGPCEAFVSGEPDTWVSERVDGLLRATIIYREWFSVTTETVTVELPLDGSPKVQGTSPNELAGAEPDADGAGWLALREATIRVEDLLPDVDTPADLRDWNWAFAEISVQVECGARIVDLCVYEQPYAAAFEADDEAIALHGSGGSTSNGGPAAEYPVQRASETTPDGDPRTGTWWMMDVADAIEQSGPVIFNWHAWDEGAAAVSDTETDFTTASTSFVAMPSPGPATYDTTGIAAGVSSCGYARRQNLADDRIVLPNAAAVPVRVAVLGKVDTGTGTVRVQTGLESYVEVTIDQTSLSWHEQWGFLRVGINPDDLTYLQQFAKKETSGTLTTRAVSVCYDQHGPGD